MCRYTREQLADKARMWVVDDAAGGDKAFQVVLQLSILTGLSCSLIVERIETLAAGEDCHA